jgi:hypothetical protein
MTNKTIKCTNCGQGVDLSQALYEELYDDVKEDYDAERDRLIQSKTQDLSMQIESLTRALERSLEDNMASQKQLMKTKLELQSSDQKKELEFNIRLSEELDKAGKQRHKEMEVFKRTLSEDAELKVKEREDTIRQLQENLKEAQQKAEQGSMQRQGEAQELLIEEYLKTTFPLDTISEIKKGALGADVLQTVNSLHEMGLGTIYYESKRTKTFNPAWIDKFKQDMIAKGADIGVLVSSARPTNTERAVLMKGIWVCSVDEFKILCHAMRVSIVEVYTAKSSEENKTDKMELLYNYLTSSEFRMQIEAIVEGFSQMQTDLESEKRSMSAIWSKREKQIVKVIDNTVGMYGSIKGIGGNVIEDIKALELK